MEEQKIKDLPASADKVTISYSYIKTTDSFLRLYHTTVSPKLPLDSDKKELKASILIFHGFAEDSSNYIPMSTYLASEGAFECHLVDFRGFGYSTGIREHVDLIEMQNDILALLAEVIKRNLSRNIQLPAFVIASSYAANILAGLLINNPDLPIAGVVMCSPAFSTHYKYSKLSIWEKLLYLYIYPLIQVHFSRSLTFIESKSNAIFRSWSVGKRQARAEEADRQQVQSVSCEIHQ